MAETQKAPHSVNMVPSDNDQLGTAITSEDIKTVSASQTLRTLVMMIATILAVGFAFGIVGGLIGGAP